MAGVRRISAISEDYPGSLLDVRHQLTADIPEARRNLSLAQAAGFGLPPGDPGTLAIGRAAAGRRPLTGAGGTWWCTPAPPCRPGSRRLTARRR